MKPKKKKLIIQNETKFRSNRIIQFQNRDNSMPAFAQFILQPEIRDNKFGKDWQNFAHGAESAGFDFLLLQNDSIIQHYQDESKQARYLIEILLPDLMHKLLSPFRPFILRNLSVNLLFYQPEMKNKVLCLYSDIYNQKILNAMTKTILPHLAQQYAYQRTLDLFKEKDYTIVAESVSEKQRISVRLRRWNFIGAPAPDILGNEITLLSGPQKEEIEFQIYSHGIIQFDLTDIDSNEYERYFRWITAELGKIISKKRFVIPQKKTNRQSVS